MNNIAVSGTKITMDKPHLAGYTPDQRPYEMWANTAVQDVTDPDLVELNKLRTKLLMQDGSTVFLDSLTGLFDNKAQTLELNKDIHLTTTTGYEAWLTQAHVDMVKNTVDFRPACRRQADQRHADLRSIAHHQWRRGRHFRGQCRDASRPSRRRHQHAAAPAEPAPAAKKKSGNKSANAK